ncbi:50S ribosomal protein L3 [Buchnera aphidicola]|uniref:50S ribosomal protein L3 n=1 Tax=Buchnera aphidicola TaxID=9 RepID=UPI0030EE1E40
MLGFVGKKVGMTRIFFDAGNSVPVSVIKIEQHRITKIIRHINFNSLQVTVGFKKKKFLKKTEKGYFSKLNILPGRGLWEFKYSGKLKYKIGDVLNIKLFDTVKKVDVTGISKGKGFAGTIKRWNFSSQDATHGNSLSHRAPGSIGQNQTPGRVFKGKKMAGHMGNEKVTIQSLKLIKIDYENNVFLIKGSIPGHKGNDVIIKPAVKQRGVNNK